MPVQVPRTEELRRIAERHGLALDDADLSAFQTLIGGWLVGYERLEHLPQQALPSRYPRLAGARPTSNQNADNAWYWRCDIKGAVSGVHRQQIRLDGTPADVRAFPDWFAWSPMADAVRTALATPVAQGQVRPWETTAPQPAGERSQSRLRE